jgi:hypothetical protein
LKSTAEELGEQYGVSKNTIIRDEEYSDAIDRVAEKVGNDALTAVEAPNVNTSPAGEVSRPSKNISAERLKSPFLPLTPLK